MAGFVYLLYPSHPTTSSCQTLLGERRSRPAGDATRERGLQPVGLAPAAITSCSSEQGAIQPVRNRCWAPRRRVAAASKRYRGLAQQDEGFPHEIAQSKLKKLYLLFKKLNIFGTSKSCSCPKTMIYNPNPNAVSHYHHVNRYGRWPMGSEGSPMNDEQAVPVVNGPRGEGWIKLSAGIKWLWSGLK